MARLNSTLVDAVSKKTLQSYELVHIYDLGGEDVTICNAPFDVVYNNTRYLALGSLLGIGEINEESQFTISEITIQVSGLPSYDNNGDSILRDLLSYNYIDRQVDVFRAFYDLDSYLDSVQIFAGRISNPIISDNPQQETTVGIVVSNNWIDYDRTNGMLTNDSRHQTLYSGDLGFEYAKDVIKDLKWQPE